MDTTSERRAFPRRPFEKAVQSYENGARFSCRPIDLSLGGAFLRVRDADRFRAGDIISVVFGAEAGWPTAIYVFGRIVRLQADPSGVALAWDRAVTTGDTAYLASFLNKTLGLKQQVADTYSESASGRFRSVFSFDLVQRAGEQHRRKLAEQAARAVKAAQVVESAPPVVEAAAEALAETADHAAARRPAHDPHDAAPVASSGRKTAAERPLHTRSIVSRLADSRARSGLSEPGTLRDPFDERTPTPHEVGALTSELRAGEQSIATKIAAVLDVDGKSYPATISMLGASRLTVVAIVAPAHVPSTVRLTADLPAPEGPRPIVADCAVHGFRRDLDGTTFDLAIDTIDENDDPGVLTRYLKWLIFQSMAAADA